MGILMCAMALRKWCYYLLVESIDHSLISVDEALRTMYPCPHSVVPSALRGVPDFGSVHFSLCVRFSFIFVVMQLIQRQGWRLNHFNFSFGPP